MIVVLAVIVGIVLLAFIWRGTRGQTQSLRVAAGGAGVVLVGVFVIGALLMVTDPGENLMIVEANFVGTMVEGREVAGTVENRTDRSMSPVRVEFDFINRESRIIESVMAEAPSLEARGRWSFTVPVPSDRIVGFRARVGSPDNVRPAWLGGGCGSSLCEE